MLTGALPQLAAAGALVVVLSALFAWLMSSPTPAAASAAPRKPAPARTTELRDFVKAGACVGARAVVVVGWWCGLDEVAGG